MKHMIYTHFDGGQHVCPRTDISQDNNLKSRNQKEEILRVSLPCKVTVSFLANIRELSF
jgi:hypothetical protein